MKFRVAREACCSQDDQAGPLAATYDLNADATLRDLCEAVMRSAFLQFTSTHAVMEGRVGSEVVVRVFGAYTNQLRSPQYVAPANSLARNIVRGGELDFRFIFEFKG